METPHPVHNPFDGRIVNSVRLIDRAELEKSIERSAAAFESTRRAPAFLRANVLRGLADGVAADVESFAQAIMREAGKPISSARVEAQRAVATLAGSAEEATRLGGESIALDTAPAGEGRIGVTRRFPIGPIAGISPFNFPLNLGIHKVGPAIASGNTILWKPPLQSPGAAMLFAELWHRVAASSGYPADALQVVLCDDTVAETLVTDPRIKMLSFTGSARVGWALKAKAGAKRVVLELGGNAAVIIASDADLAVAAKKCAAAGFGYAGQVCIAVQRIIVHESISAEFRARLLPEVAALVVGNPAGESVQVGPMVSAREADRVEAWIAEALAGGANLISGGKREGLLITPAVFENVSPEMKIVAEEVFGPVVTLQTYSDWDDALAMVNASKYGLQAGIFTSDMRQILRAFDQIEAGAVIVGDVPTLRIDSMPYGGEKDSGLGREGMRYAIREMMSERLLVLPSG